MLSIAIVLALLAYAVVVSQPLAYLFFLGQAQRDLSAPAYIELRQRINAVMKRRIPVVYAIALAALLLQMGVAWPATDWGRFAAAAVALLCLVADAVLAVRANVPINDAMDSWTTSAHPEDWDRQRARWFAAFARRQVVMLAGLLALLIGAVA